MTIDSKEEEFSHVSNIPQAKEMMEDIDTLNPKEVKYADLKDLYLQGIMDAYDYQEVDAILES